MIQNTRQMSLDPESPDSFSNMDELRDQPVQCALVFDGDYFRRQVCYSVIVEMWNKAKSGRQRRLYLQEFTEAERKKIATYYARFYRWHLVTGTPDKVSCRLDTLQLLQRAVNFFGSI